MPEASPLYKALFARALPYLLMAAAPAVMVGLDFG